MKPGELSLESENEEDEVLFVDESSEESKDSGEERDVYYDGMVNRCAKCDNRFVGVDKESAVRCDTLIAGGGSTQNVLASI